MLQLNSIIDNSINFVKQETDKEFIEARYVHRANSNHAIVYISSQTACSQLCKFCHLTQTGQIRERDCTIEEMLEQVDVVWPHIAFNEIETIHFNFMSRGEPLSNNIFLKNFGDLFFGFLQRCSIVGKQFKVLISTILPKGNIENIQDSISKILTYDNVFLYYSMYGNEKFRKKFIPNGYDLTSSLELLSELNNKFPNRIVFHWAFIKGYNDDINDMEDLVLRVKGYGFTTNKLNIVRYNDYSGRFEESSEEHLQQLLQIWNNHIPNIRSKIVPRVGYDVKASCGMFIS